jgi:predicted DCC family thiol-disulfide oxidoreductase YuxK
MPGQILLYDGVCGFCNGVVQFVLKHDKKGALGFAPLQSVLAREILSRFPQFKSADTVVFYEPVTEGFPERAFIRTDAGLRVARYLGGWWRLLVVFWIVPRPIRDFFYDFFARYRYRLFGKHETCVVPPLEVRSRFLDL